MTPLSALAQSAIASIGTDRDLRLRTTLRRDDVHVWTTWLPVKGCYETIVFAPADVLARVRDSEIQTETVQAARLMHGTICDHVEECLRGWA